MSLEKGHHVKGWRENRFPIKYRLFNTHSLLNRCTDKELSTTISHSESVSHRSFVRSFDLRTKGLMYAMPTSAACQPKPPLSPTPTPSRVNLTGTVTRGTCVSSSLSWAEFSFIKRQGYDLPRLNKSKYSRAGKSIFVSHRQAAWHGSSS